MIEQIPIIQEQGLGGFKVSFPSARLWDFIELERFEIDIEPIENHSLIRHQLPTLDCVVTKIKLADIEALLQKRTKNSNFTEIYLEHDDVEVLCWGCYQPPKKRRVPFLLRGCFHPSPQIVRFEFYDGMIFGELPLTKTELSAELFKSAKLPVIDSHPHVIQIDAMSELSLEVCLEWGWKLPQRKFNGLITIRDGEIIFRSGKSIESPFSPPSNYRKHLSNLKRISEAEQLVFQGEYPVALDCYLQDDSESLLERAIELSLLIKDKSQNALELISKALAKSNDLENINHLKDSDQIWSYGALAKYYERTNAQHLAIETWLKILKTVHTSQLEQGLILYSVGMLYDSTNDIRSLEQLEKARVELPKSLPLIDTISQIAIFKGNMHLAEVRLTELGQRFTEKNYHEQAAKTWVKLGELWRQNPDNYNRAERTFNRALKLVPNYIPAFQGLSGLAEDRGNLLDACQYLDQAITLTENNHRLMPVLKEMRARFEQLSMPAKAFPPVEVDQVQVSSEVAQRSVNVDPNNESIFVTENLPKVQLNYSDVSDSLKNSVPVADLLSMSSARDKTDQVELPFEVPSFSKRSQSNQLSNRRPIKARPIKIESVDSNRDNLTSDELGKQKSTARPKKTFNSSVSVLDRLRQIKKSDHLSSDQFAAPISSNQAPESQPTQAEEVAKEYTQIATDESDNPSEFYERISLTDIAAVNHEKDNPSPIEVPVDGFLTPATSNSEHVDHSTHSTENHSSVYMKISLSDLVPLKEDELGADIATPIPLTEFYEASPLDPIESSSIPQSGLNKVKGTRSEDQRSTYDDILDVALSSDEPKAEKFEMELSDHPHEIHTHEHVNPTMMLTEEDLEEETSVGFRALSDNELEEKVAPAGRKMLNRIQAGEEQIQSLDEITEILQLKETNLPQEQGVKRWNALLELALSYRDDAFDLEMAQDRLLTLIFEAPDQHSLCADALEHLTDLYTSTQNWEDLLVAYEISLEKKVGDPVFLHLQRAATLKTLKRPQEALEASELAIERSDGLYLWISLCEELEEWQKAYEFLSETISHLSDEDEIRYRLIICARLLSFYDPQQAHQLYDDLTDNLSDSDEELFQSWRENCGKLSDELTLIPWTRKYARFLFERGEVSHRCSRMLLELAESIVEQSPELAVLLYDDALSINPMDVQIAERLLNLSEYHADTNTSTRALVAMIDQSLEGPYRGILRLKLVFTQAVDHRTDQWIIDFKNDFQPPLEAIDYEDLRTALLWGKERVTEKEFEDILTTLKQIGLEIDP